MTLLGSRGVLRNVILVAVTSAAGCVDSQTVQCGDRVCPSGNLCSPDGARCALLSQLEACADAPDGQTCTYAGTDGACVGGVCVGTGCGNEQIEPGEVCDDGNTASGDGCSSDCQSNETCGNGYIDAKTGERCDDGNQVDGDGCSVDCSEKCGNGIKDGAEECDGTDFGILTCLNYDHYEGTLTCDAMCRVDASECVSSCGDAAQNGPELCDGSDLGGLSCQTYGWYSGTLTCSAECNGVEKSACTDYCGDGVVNGSELCDGEALGGEDCRAIGALDGALDCNAFCQPTRDRCHWGRWRVQPPIGFFQDIWAVSANDVWAVGGDGSGYVFHYDGASWSDAFPTGFFNTLFGLWAQSPTDVWAVGDFGVILHYNGTAWSIVHSSVDPSPITTQRLYDVWASGPNDAWAVGANGTILHRTSSGWSVDPQSGVVTNFYLKKVWGSGQNDVWALGDGDSNGIKTTLLHYTDSTWTAITDPAVADYPSTGLWGGGLNDVWLVGDALHHYTGTWTTSSTPSSLVLGDVRGTAATSLWAFGTDGRLVHYDGTSWTEVEGATSTGLSFRNISPTAAGDVWGASTQGIYHYDGPSWRDDTTSSGTLLGIWGTSANDIWAVSSSIRHYDGSTWTQNNPTNDLNAVWGRNATDVWAVGGSGKVLHYDGSWGTAPGSGSVTDRLYGVWGSGANDVWAVGSFEAIVHYNGSTWSKHAQSGNISTTTIKPFMYCLWGSGPSDVWAGGLGAVYHFGGTSWSKIGIPGSASLRGMWGAGPKDIWAVGDLGVLVHYDGTSWKLDPASGTMARNGLLTAWGTSSSDVWAAGFDGVLIHYDGSRWSAGTSITNKQILGGWGSAPNNEWAVGESGTTLHLTTTFPSEYGGSCRAPIPLYCGTQATPFVQYGAVSATTNQFASYTCVSGENGGETYYRLDVPVTGQVTVKLTPTGGDLDLVQLGADSAGGCAATGACMASHLVGPTTAETITVNTVQGQTLYFVVDGPTAADATYSIQTSCIKQ